MSKTDENRKLDAQILKRFKIVNEIGSGAYGIVFEAIDKVTHQKVALKKIFGAFRNSTDSQRTFREITFLKQLRGHPHIVELYNVFKAQNNYDLYVSFEILESNVHNVIRANILEDVHKRFIIYQLLIALKYIHSRRLIHRDLKPANLLINSDSSVKLCDFGLARTMAEGDICQAVMTDYVSTRWYRAPELIIGSNHYNEGVDMWAVGCIAAELYAGRPLFPGSSTLDQMERVVAFTGPPSPSDLESMHSEFAETMIANLTYNHPKITLAQKLPTADPTALDFISKLLVFNPENRMTAVQCLEHPFVARFKGTEDESLTGEPVKLSLNDSKRYTVKDYRNKLYKESLSRLGGESVPMEKIPGSALPFVRNVK